MLDDLYGAHPSEFVAARDALAKNLRDEGEREEADRVKKLRRPSTAAWLLNATALTKPKILREFAKASEALEKAQARALEGGDVEKWRAAAARERKAAEAVIEAAEREARDAGHPATKPALDLVDGTLRAAAADPDLRERVVAGRLEREQTGATIGPLLTGGPAAAGKRSSAPSEKDSARKRSAAQAAREAKRVERRLAEAEGREQRRQAEVEKAAADVRRVKAALADAKRETAGLRRELKSARKRAKA